jgi:hypothetical protein
MATSADAALHWFQNSLLNALEGSGPAVLKHRRLLESSISAQMERCLSYRGTKWAAKTLRYLLKTLCMVYPSSRGLETSQLASAGKVFLR